MELEKEDLKNLSRKELVDVVYNMMDEENSDPGMRPLPAEVAGERRRLRQRARLRRKLLTTLGILTVVAAAAVLLSTFLFPVIQVTGQLCCVAWQNKLLIKRVIALSGDQVDIDQSGNVTVNGQALDEPYVTEKSLGECDIEFPYQVPEGKVFVMGDRRASSIDSRSSAIGCVGDDQIVGRVLFKVWPIG